MAIKALHNIHSSDVRADVMREAAIMNACRHPHVVQVSPLKRREPARKGKSVHTLVFIISVKATNERRVHGFKKSWGCSNSSDFERVASQPREDLNLSRVPNSTGKSWRVYNCHVHISGSRQS